MPVASRARSRLRLAACAALALASGLAAPSPAGPLVPGARREVEFSGMCDASAAVALSDRLFAVADDEQNVLRVYDGDRGGSPLSSFDLSAPLGLARQDAKTDGAKKKKKKKASKQAKPGPELDLEAATRVGDEAFWLTSHGRNAAGKLRPERHRFFATRLPSEGEPLSLVGSAYASLVGDLAADPRFAAFDLARAAERGPKEAGGLNIEGMTRRVEGGVWIGFRNPIPGGKALLFALLDPDEVVAGGRPRFGDPLLLELGGLGVRALSRWHGRYLIVAGPYESGGTSWLYTWDGVQAPRRVPTLEFEHFNPEAFFAPEERDEILLLSDDGARELHGKECKRLKDAGKKRFRGVWLALPPT